MNYSQTVSGKLRRYLRLNQFWPVVSLLSEVKKTLKVFKNSSGIYNYIMNIYSTEHFFLESISVSVLFYSLVMVFIKRTYWCFVIYQIGNELPCLRAVGCRCLSFLLLFCTTTDFEKTWSNFLFNFIVIGF